jgi:DNA-binding transcriptional regulator YdaS (Cro superfamily)
MIDSMLLSLWLSKKRGRAAALAGFLKIPASFVSAMAAGEKPIPFVHGAPIELFTNGEVTRKEMFPDDWQTYWPELARASCRANLKSSAPGGTGGMQLSLEA